MPEDIVSVLRIVEYRGPRGWVERTISESIQGTRHIASDRSISAATIGEVPKILQAAEENHQPGNDEQETQHTHEEDKLCHSQS